MPAERLSMRKVRDVLRLLHQSLVAPARQPHPLPGPKLWHSAPLALQKGQEIRVDRFGLGRRHAVRKILVGFQGAVLQQLGG
jgi:hypothetical protein